MKAKGGSAQKKGLHVGDRVRFLFGKDPVEGVIVEDRGLLAAGGRRLWAIEFHLDQPDASVIELAEEDLLPES